jgi:ATP-dependent RNA helicase SUPV3L1/SUV3
MPNPGLVSVTLPEIPQPPPEDPQAPRPPESWPPGFAAFAGWLQAGHVLLRLDVVERIAGELGHLTRRAPAPVPEGLASRLGIKGDVLPMVLDAMGFRLTPATPMEEGQFGPPAPARISVLRNDRPQRPPQRPGRQDRPQGERPQGERPQGERPQGERRRGERREGQPGDAPRWDPAVMFGPPIPRELRGPRPDRGQGQRPDQRQGPRPDQRPDQRPDRGPRRDGPPRPREDRAVAGAAPPQGAPRRDDRGPRPDRLQPERPRFDRPRQDGQRPDGSAPRPDRPRFDGPRRDREADRGPREYQSGPKPDSPFAILANLKVKKD